MTHRDLASFWHFDLDDRFVSHPRDEDGYVVFKTATRSNWACVHDIGNKPPAAALNSGFVSGVDGPGDYCFRDDPWLQGRCHLTHFGLGDCLLVNELIQENPSTADPTWMNNRGSDGLDAIRADDKKVLLATHTAAKGALAKLDFYLESKSDVEWALEAWRSIQYTPPDWIRLWMSSNNSLFGIRQALETAIRIEEEICLLKQSGELAAAIPIISAAQQDPRRTVRQSACYALGVVGDPDSQSILLQMTNDEEPLVQLRAAEALYKLGVPFDAIGPIFATGLASPRKAIFEPYGYPDRYIAALLLKNIGPLSARFTADALRRCLLDESGYVRAMAAQALTSQGEPTTAVLPGLLDAITKRRMPLRELVRVAELLFELGHPMEQVLPVVVDAVEAREWPAFADAMNLLQRMRDSAKSAINSVIAAAADDDPKICSLAERTLLQITPPKQR